jgi:23S rRNA U2552 (ribose-2'-O)-methylase RlmE/FtsJ
VQLGTENCHLVMKTVEGDTQKRLVSLLEFFFQQVHRFKPKSSRKESAEHYIVCKELSIASRDPGRLLAKLREL